MTTEALDSIDKIPDTLAEKLHGLRRRLARWFLVDGLNRVLLTLAVIVVVDLGIDWYFRMDKAQRGIMMLLSFGVLGYIVWRFLFKPLSANLSDEALCLEIERHHEGLSEQLISALEFSRIDWKLHPEVALGMVKATIAEGMRAGEQVNLSKVLRRERFQVNSFLLGLLLLLSVAAVAWGMRSDLARTWFNRNVMLGDAAWPQDFYFHIEGAIGQHVRVPRGDDWPLVAQVKPGFRYLPKEVTIEFRTPSGRRLETMDASEDGMAFRYQMVSVTEPLEFRLTSKSVRTEWYALTLLQRPEIAEVSLVSRPPNYTGVSALDLPAGQSPYYLLKGSSLQVSGQADKLLSRATLKVGDQVWTLSAQGKAFTGAIPEQELISGTYVLDVEDEEQLLLPGEDLVSGLGVREPLKFQVRLKDDETPKVKASLNGVSGMVVSRARLPYTATLSDDFALTKVSVDWGWREDKSDAEETTGSLVPKTDSLPQQLVSLKDEVDLEPLEIPSGSRLNLTFTAQDNDIVSGPKTGHSSNIVLRVVSESELRDDLLRREKEQRQLFAEMVDQQDTLLTECQALQATTRGLADLSKDQRGEVVKLQKRQKLLGNGLRPLLDRFRSMNDEIRNNRLEEEDGVLQRRLVERIIQPLNAVYQNPLPMASEALEVVRREADLTLRQAAFEAAVSNQQAALEVMREVLVHMVKSEGYQQAVNLLYEIQKSQEDLKKRTEKQKKEWLDGVLQKEKSDAGANTNPPETP